ncbi:MAG: pseudouridine synthase [Lachnospiraceae bacterium]
MGDLIRLNKYMSAAGFCSRRKADEWIAAGKVKVNGVIANTGMKVCDSDEILVNGKVLEKKAGFKLVAFYKPKGYAVTFHGGDQSGIFANFPLDSDLRYIGRLDKDSEGLLLLTNDGNLCNEISKSKNEHEKEYIVTVNRDITDDFLLRMGTGVRILDGNKNRYVVTRPCKVNKLDNRRFSIILTQGYNRQIRRMCEYFDYRVVMLRRIRVMNILLGDMKPGEIRKVSKEEAETLKEMCMKKGTV